MPIIKQDYGSSSMPSALWSVSMPIVTLLFTMFLNVVVIVSMLAFANFSIFTAF